MLINFLFLFHVEIHCNVKELFLVQTIDELELIRCNGPNLTWSRQFACDGSFCVLHGTPKRCRGRNPIANLVGNDADDRYTRVRLVTFVYSIVEVCKVSSNERRPQLVDSDLVTRDGGFAFEFALISSNL